MEVIFNRQTIIEFPDNPDLPDITPEDEGSGGIADGSMYVDEVLYTERYTIGVCNANRFEVELYNYPMIDKGTKIHVYQIIDEVEGEEPVNKDIFTGYVDTCLTNRGRQEDSKKVTAYDALYYYAKTDVAEWWEQEYDTAVAKPLGHLREDLLDYLSIPYEDVTLANDSITIRQTQQLNKISFKDMFNYIIQLNATTPTVDRDGTVRFISTTTERTPIAIDSVYAQNTSEFDTYNVPKYKGVRITNSAKNITAKVGSSKGSYDITDNLLIMNKGQASLDEIAQNIYDVIKDVTYRPAQIDMIYNQLDIKVGDRVTIGNKEYLVCENTLSGSLLVEQHISSIGENSFSDTSTKYDAGKVAMQQEIQASSLKYYRAKNGSGIVIANDTTKTILSIRYTCSETGMIIFHGCAIIDVERIDTTQEAQVIIQYEVANEIVREYTPTETYHHDGRHTIPLLHYWELDAGVLDTFKVHLTTSNCKVTIGAFRCEGYMEGMGLVGEAAWDGIIEVEDTITPITFRTTPSAISTITDELTVSVDNVTITQFEDTVTPIAFRNTPRHVTEFTDVMYVNKSPLRLKTWGDIKDKTWGEVKDEYIW